MKFINEFEMNYLYPLCDIEAFTMANRDIIVIGASAGGLEVLKNIISHLPGDFPASIFVVWHMAPDVRGILPDIFNKLNTILATNAVDNEPIAPNHIYVAPPDHHLLIEDGRIKVTHGPKENRFRPAVDPLFRSAAYAFGARVIGVILSGGLDDGAAGLWRIKLSGGLTVVQDPMDAEVSSMPENALRAVQVDYCVPSSDLASLFIKLTVEEVAQDTILIRDNKTKMEIEIAAEMHAMQMGSLKIGTLSPFTCPECGAVLSRITDGNIIRFRCHTGHAYSMGTLTSALSENIEKSTHSTIREMEESIFLLNHLGDHFAENNQLSLAAVYFNKANDVLERSNMLRSAVDDHQQLGKDNFGHQAEDEFSHQ